MRVKDFAKIYFAIVLLYLATIYRGDTGLLYWISKPLILVSLLLFTASKIHRFSRPTGLWLLAAFGFSLLGDVLLMFSAKAGFFMAGMGAFAVAHLAFIRFHWHRLNLSFFAIGLISVMVLFALLLTWIELPQKLQIPIYIYGAVMGLHQAVALSAVKSSFRHYGVALGVALFVLSDLFIALNRFDAPTPWWEYSIMPLYAGGQFLIMWGALLSPNKDLHRK